MTDFLHNNDFAVRYSDLRSNHLAHPTDPHWLDANSCIDTIRNALFEAGWSFVNPLKIGDGSPMPLGAAILATSYAPGDSFMNFDPASIKTLPHKEDGGGNVTVMMRTLLRTSSSSALYQVLGDSADQTAFLIANGSIPPLSPPGFRIFVFAVAGLDAPLPTGSILPQVRGLPAYRESGLATGSFAGFMYGWFADRAGTASGTVVGTVPPGPDPGATVELGPNSPKNHIISAGIDNFVGAMAAAVGDSWKFRREHPGDEGPGSYPDSDTFHALDFVTTTGRDSSVGLPDFSNDMTGTIGNNALLHLDVFTAGFQFNGSALPDNLGTTTGGGWVMSNPGSEITLIVRQCLEVGASTHFDAIEFLFADSRSSIRYSPFFYGRPAGAVSYQIYGARGLLRLSGAGEPEYRVIASSHALAIVDAKNATVPNPATLANNCLLVCAPRLAQEQLDGGATRSVLIVGPNNLNQGMAWDQTFSVSNDGADFITSTALATTRAGICTTAFGFNYPLLTSNGRTFLQNAWVMAPPAGRDGPESQILGRVPDCLVLTGDQPQGYRFSFDGHTFVCIATQGPGTGSGGRDRPVCSLWMAAD